LQKIWQYNPDRHPQAPVNEHLESHAAVAAQEPTPRAANVAALSSASRRG